MKRWTLRISGLVLMFVCIAAPSPGNVGGCAANRRVANPEEHCINTEFWKCRRDQFAGRIDQAEYDACLVPIRGRCSAAAWPMGCEPTTSSSTACVTLLSRMDLAEFTTPDLLATFPDCNLCE